MSENKSKKSENKSKKNVEFSQKSVKSVRNIRSNIEVFLKRHLKFPAYLLYCFNEENLQFKLIALPQHEPATDLKTTQEVFNLGKPCLFLEGKPLYLVVREIPYSINLELEKHKAILKEKGYDSQEIKAKIHSIYTYFVFGISRINIQFIVSMILIVICTVLTTFMLTGMYYKKFGVA